MEEEEKEEEEERNDEGGVWKTDRWLKQTEHALLFESCFFPAWKTSCSESLKGANQTPVCSQVRRCSVKPRAGGSLVHFGCFGERKSEPGFYPKCTNTCQSLLQVLSGCLETIEEKKRTKRTAV